MIMTISLLFFIWNSFGGTSVEATHTQLYKNSCLHSMPSIACLVWIWPNHLRSACCRGYSHHSGTELLPTHESSSSWYSSLLWLNVLFAGNWRWRHREPFYLAYHEPALVIEWQGHICPFLLSAKPLWHWGKWKSGPNCKRDPWSSHRPIGKCPL